MAIDVEAEIRDLKRRVSKIEGSFGFLTQQIRGVHKDLLDFEAKAEQRFEKVDKRFDDLDNKVDRVDRKIDSKVDGLAKALPGIVSEAMREAVRDGGGKSRKKP